MSKPKYTIAVTGLNAIDSPGPGIAVLRALKDASTFDVRLIGLAYDALEPCIYLREFVDKTYLIPLPSAGQEVLFSRLEYICQNEKVDFLFPNFDAELFNFIKLQAIIDSQLGVKMVLPTVQQFEERHKSNLYEFGLKHSIKVPQTTVISSHTGIIPFAEKKGYPIVVKGKFYDAKIAYNYDQAVQYFNKISSQWGLPILAQEFIEGSEVNVCGVGDGNGLLVGAVPMRKLYITDKGKAWAGVTLENDELLAITSNLVKSSKWKGPFELEFVKTKDGVFYLIEINPRFPAWCYLTVGAGQNQIEATVNIGMGNPIVPFTTYKAGTMFIRYSNDNIVDIKDFEAINTSGEF